MRGPLEGVPARSDERLCRARRGGRGDLQDLARVGRGRLDVGGVAHEAVQGRDAGRDVRLALDRPRDVALEAVERQNVLAARLHQIVPGVVAEGRGRLGVLVVGDGERKRRALERRRDAGRARLVERRDGAEREHRDRRARGARAPRAAYRLVARRHAYGQPFRRRDPQRARALWNLPVFAVAPAGSAEPLWTRAGRPKAGHFGGRRLYVR